MHQYFLINSTASLTVARSVTFWKFSGGLGKRISFVSRPFEQKISSGVSLSLSLSTSAKISSRVEIVVRPLSEKFNYVDDDVVVANDARSRIYRYNGGVKLSAASNYDILIPDTRSWTMGELALF